MPKPVHIPSDLVSFNLLLSAFLVWFAVLIRAIWWAPWHQFLTNRLLNLFLGAVAAMLLLWNFEASVTPGLGFHFLGVTVFTLMFGWSFGVIGVSLVSLGIALKEVGFESLSLNALVLGVLPVSVSYGIYDLVYRYLPRHVFVYIFVNAFLGSMIAAGMTVFAIVSVLLVMDTYPLSRITEEYLPFLPLYLFPEGLLNGMLATVFIGLRPQWLKTFDDEIYLKH